METLIKKYEKLLNHEIPKPIKKRKTFLEIGNVPHFENVISNYYAFYLDKNEEHNFKELFFKSLTELIEEKSQKIIEIDDYEVLTEYSTTKNGRIDILIEDFNNEKVIIIENKIYHSLQNDLNDYWNSFNHIDDKNRVGVLLTLEKQHTNNPNFVNITHRQLISKVKKNIGLFIANSDDRHLLFFKDFSENLMMLSNNKSDMKDNLKFYFEHKIKIEELYEMREEMRKHFLNSVKDASIRLGLNLENSNPKDFRCITISEKPYLRYWISLVQNSADDFLHIYLDIYDESKKHSEMLIENKLLISISEKNDINLENFDEVKNGVSIASKFYSLDFDKFSDLGKSISDLIEKDWKELADATLSEITRHNNVYKT